ncbi:MAG: FUSC family protein [Mycobacterium sp.]|nr:FUSC family protein [Mycobacterium sp.]
MSAARPPGPLLRAGFSQLWLSARDWPPSEGTWLSVIRRSAVVAVFMVIGLTTGNLVAGIGAAFGALQMGLMEAAVPLRRLFWLLALNVTALAATAFAASALGGTWWTPVLLGGIALMQGSTLSAGMIPGNTFIGLLSIGVIFAAVPRGVVDAGVAAASVAVGALAQTMVWLLVWKLDRKLFVRRALANGLRVTRRMLNQNPGDARFMTMASTEPERILSILESSGVSSALLAEAQAVSVATSEVRRSVISWMVLHNPSAAEKQRLAVHLDQLTAVLDDVPGRPIARLGGYTFSAHPDWACDHALAADLADLERTISAYRTAEHKRAPDTRPPPTNELAATLKSLSAANPNLHYGIRMASAIAVGQAITLVVDVAHSFWVPLTIVFVLKPDWSFTAVRTVGRIAGNLAAVLIVPFALTLAGSQIWAFALLMFVLAVIMYRYFTGNYIAACLGLAGSVLVLDEVLTPDDSLYAARFIATVVGTILALVFSLIVPTWRSAHSPRYLTQTVAALRTWTAATMQALVSPDSCSPSELRGAGANARRALYPLRSTAEAAMLEPVGRIDRTALRAQSLPPKEST